MNNYYPCSQCGEKWSVDEQGKGARYFHSDSWFCSACWQVYFWLEEGLGLTRP